MRRGGARLSPCLVVLILTSLVAAGCGGGRREGAIQEAPHTAAPPAAQAEAGHPRELHVDREMLRDLRLTTATAEERAGGDGVSALGELRVDEEAYAEVGTPVAAHVVRLMASPGERVRTGQPLVALRSVEVGRAHAESVAALARAEAASRALERKTGLAADQIAPQREVEEARAEAAAAAADVRAARAALRALGVDEQDIEAGGQDATYVLRAPLHGVVLERNARTGQMADPARPLFRIADLSGLWLTVHAFERDAVRVRAGVTARITFPALPGRTFDGAVALVGREVDPGSRTIPIRIDVANHDDLLRPGMSASAWIPIGDAGDRLVAVPVAALQRLDDDWCVFVPKGPGEFEIRPVGRGRDLGNEVEILNGLAAGETIVVEGAFLLKAEAEKARGEGGHHDH